MMGVTCGARVLEALIAKALLNDTILLLTDARPSIAFSMPQYGPRLMLERMPAIDFIKLYRTGMVAATNLDYMPCSGEAKVFEVFMRKGNSSIRKLLNGGYAINWRYSRKRMPIIS